MKVVTSGYPSIDRIFQLNASPQVGKTSIILNDDNWVCSFGGCSPNIAYSLSKLGVDTYPIMRVGSDFESTGYKKYLLDVGVKLDFVEEIKDDVTSFCLLFEDDNCEHTTLFYEGAQSSKHFFEIENSNLKDAEYGIITVGNPDDNWEFLNKCKENGVPTVFGMRGDQNAFSKEFLLDALTYSKLIFMNDIEREFIEDYLELSDINDLYDRGNVQIIVITKGKDGSSYSTKQDKKFISVPSIHTENKVDTTGAGDAFISGFMFGLLKNESLYKCAQFGSAMSHFVIQKKGCTTNVPSLDELIETVNSI